MKHLKYIFIFFVCNLFAQHQTMLLVSQQQYANEAPSGTEIATWDDAAANTSASEINGLHYVTTTEGWRDGVRCATASVGTTSQLGSYSVEIKATSTFSAYGRYYFPVTTGNNYTLSFYAKRGIGTDQKWKTNSGAVTPSGDISITTTDWVKHEYTFEANATVASIYFYVLNSGAVDDTLYIDNVSILEL